MAKSKKQSTKKSSPNPKKQRNVGEFLQGAILEATGISHQIEELTERLEALKLSLIHI